MQAILDKSSVTPRSHEEQRAGATTQSDDRPALLAKVLSNDASAELRRIAAWGLQEYTDTPAAVAALTNAVKHDADASVREMSAWALGDGGASDAATLSALSAALRSDAV